MLADVCMNVCIVYMLELYIHSFADIGIDGAGQVGVWSRISMPRVAIGL